MIHDGREYACCLGTLSIAGASIDSSEELPPIGAKVYCNIKSADFVVRDMKAELVRMPNGRHAMLFTDLTHRQKRTLQTIVDALSRE